MYKEHLSMERMCRTQIYLPADLIAGLDRLARQRGTSRADLIRLAARQLIEREENGEEDPILGLIGLGTAGPGRTSEEHDKVLAEYILATHSR
jgi:metal-responsive CopG/Arc/MetJ family transcriptional regulator